MWPCSSSSLMERAKEELEILRSQHPNRFDFLKLELESFISLLRDDHAPPPPSSDLHLLTQASSNCDNKNKKNKKKRKDMEKCGDQVSSMENKSSSNNIKMDQRMMMTKRKDRVDVVLERAQLCLQKIRDVKSSLC